MSLLPINLSLLSSYRPQANSVNGTGMKSGEFRNVRPDETKNTSESNAGVCQTEAQPYQVSIKAPPIIIGTRYENFYPSGSTEKIIITNSALLTKLTSKDYTIKDKTTFRQFIIDRANSLGYTNIKALSPKEAIDLATKITHNTLRGDYFGELPDDEGAELSVEKLADAGVGVCRHYAKFYCAVFDIIKDINPNLENIYASFFHGNAKTFLGGGHHGWVLLTALKKNTAGQLVIIYTHLDPTWSDYDGILDKLTKFPLTVTPNAYDSNHGRTFTTTARFFGEMGYYKEAVASYVSVVDSHPEFEDEEIDEILWEVTKIIANHYSRKERLELYKEIINKTDNPNLIQYVRHRLQEETR